MTILLIDDHPAIQSLVKQHILAFSPNADVMGCFNINDAKQLFSRQAKIDFVISDLELVEGCNLDVLNICHRNHVSLKMLVLNPKILIARKYQALKFVF